jgi:CDP-glycerol glycerophosphotransferase (TagB/SpsB family)
MSFSKHFAKFSYLRRLKNYIFSPYNNIKPSYEIVSSGNTLDAASLLDSEKDNERERIISLGLPKCDHILNLSKLPKEFLNQVTNQYSKKTINEDSKIILFLPTWRQDKNFNLFDYGFDFDRLNDILEENNATMIINFHPFDESIRVLGTKKLTGRIRHASFTGDTVLRFLCASDILVTDYSSLYSDYLLLDRPIIFSKFDYYNYTNERDINVNYESLPGITVSNWKGVCDSLEEVFNKGIDIHKKSRNAWRGHIYSGHDDGKSCERIQSFINEVL